MDSLPAQRDSRHAEACYDHRPVVSSSLGGAAAIDALARWEHDAQGRHVPPVRTMVLLPTLRRSLLALLKVPARAYGRCRTRWSCATRALTLQATWSMMVSAETLRRWLHQLGWEWKRTKLVVKDDAPQRVDRLARIRVVYEQLPRCEAMVFADARDIHLWPKVGCAWMSQGTQLAVMTPGQNQKYSLAGALDLATGTLHHSLGARNTNAWFRDVLGLLDERYPAEQYMRLYVVVENDKLIKLGPLSHGWLPTRGIPGSCCRPTVPARTRLSARSVMCMTAVPAIIGVNGYPIWWPTWKTMGI
jgi:hypothetical protein